MLCLFMPHCVLFVLPACCVRVLWALRTQFVGLFAELTAEILFSSSEQSEYAANGRVTDDLLDVLAVPRMTLFVHNRRGGRVEHD